MRQPLRLCATRCKAAILGARIGYGWLGLFWSCASETVSLGESEANSVSIFLRRSDTFCRFSLYIYATTIMVSGWTLSTEDNCSSFSSVGLFRPRSKVLRYVRLLIFEKSSWVSCCRLRTCLSARPNAVLSSNLPIPQKER